MEESREKEWEAAESFLFPGIHFLNKLWNHLPSISVFLFVFVAVPFFTIVIHFLLLCGPVEPRSYNFRLDRFSIERF